MSLSLHLDAFLSSKPLIETGQNLASLLDFTLLNAKADQASIMSLYEQGRAAEVAALCLLPEHLAYLPKTKLNLATVVNFPEGCSETGDVLKAIDAAALNQALEIDYVFPYQLYLQGQVQEAIEACTQIVNHCRQSGLKVKIILETGAFANLECIYQASIDLINTGCNFIKTSTGKIPQGASLSAAFAMLAAIKDSNSSCGIKFSGGIHTRQQALSYLNLVNCIFDKKINSEWLRFGSSRLLI